VYGIMYLAGISMFCTVAVLSVHHGHRRPTPVPLLLRRVVLGIIGRMLRMTGGRLKVRQQVPFDPPVESDASATDATTTSGHQNNAKANDESMTTTSDAVRSSDQDHQQSEQTTHNEWIEMARVIDRFFFVVFSSVIVVVTIALLIVMAVKGPRRVEPIM